MPEVTGGARIDYRSFRHWGGFVFSGGTAFLVDAAITGSLIHFAGVDPFSSRLVAIAAAMVVAWLLHRRLTFDMATAPSIGEFGRFASVAIGASLVNYAVYALVLLARPATPPLFALVLGTAVAMVVSYLGFRLRVFRPTSGVEQNRPEG
jgi:putative flippase GtrA